MTDQLLDLLIPVSPFTNEFVKAEIDFMDFAKGHPVEYGDVSIKHNKIIGRCDDYLNQNFRTGELTCPALFIQKNLWMSLTPMEIESNFLPAVLAEGSVATGGLGMGYFTLRVAENSCVDEVHVYEQNEDVIKYFKQKYSGCEYMDKIIIHHEDVYQGLKNKSFDFVYMDIYQDLLGDEVLTDIEYFCTNNDISTYRFWGEELLKWQLLNEGLIDVDELSLYERAYFQHFVKADKPDIPRHIYGDEFFEDAVEVMRKHTLLCK